MNKEIPMSCVLLLYMYLFRLWCRCNIFIDLLTTNLLCTRETYACTWL